MYIILERFEIFSQNIFELVKIYPYKVVYISFEELPIGYSPLSRFSLLLLEPGEIYFEDFSAFMYPWGVSEEEASQKYVYHDSIYQLNQQCP